MVVPVRKGRIGSCFLVGIEFEFCKMERFWKFVGNNVNIVDTKILHSEKWLSW